jgi:hypothetical protein
MDDDDEEEDNDFSAQLQLRLLLRKGGFALRNRHRQSSSHLLRPLFFFISEYSSTHPALVNRADNSQRLSFDIQT